MSGEQGSRKAQAPEEIKPLWPFARVKGEADFKSWLTENVQSFKGQDLKTFELVEAKFVNFYGDETPLPEGWQSLKADAETTAKLSESEGKESSSIVKPMDGAPSIIDERFNSVPVRPPESEDVKYLSELEYAVGEKLNTLDTMLVHDPNLPEGHQGPFIERCVGRDPDSKKLMVVKLRAREVKIEPWQVMRFRGHVIQDHLSTHSATIVLSRRRYGYVFDRFYIDHRNNKRYERCCLVLDRVHQAGLMYEKQFDKKARKSFATTRKIRGPMSQITNDTMYEVIGYTEKDYRDLKKLYERHYMTRGDESLAEDIGLKQLLAGQ